MPNAKSWNSDLATLWTKMVGPSRPTCSELNVYLKYIRELQYTQKRKLKMLVLGSTPEFRDLGFEESMDVTIIDCNLDYHNTINREIHHKVALNKEHFLNQRWQDLDFPNTYDIIIGDLVVGNLAPEELEAFIKRVSKSLTNGGFYLGKSFFQLDNYTKKSPKETLEEYYANPAYHPYSKMIYDFSIYSLDGELLYFSKMYDIIKNLHSERLMDDDTFWYFNNIGLDKGMEFTFYIPSFEYYKSLVNKYLTIRSVDYGNDIYSKQFPLLIPQKTN